MNEFQIVALSPPGLVDPSIPIAASRAGFLGVLNLEHAVFDERVVGALQDLSAFAGSGVGLRVEPHRLDIIDYILESAPEVVEFVVLSASHLDLDASVITTLRRRKFEIWAEVISESQAANAVNAGADRLVAKGSEAGGWVGEETTFILLQRLLARFDLPVLAFGGIGLHTAAAVLASGAKGVVLDTQLALARESRLPLHVKEAVGTMDGSETRCIGGELHAPIRVFTRPRLPVLEELDGKVLQIAEENNSGYESRSKWDELLAHRIGWTSPLESVWPIGQDAAFAARLADRYVTVSGILQAIEKAAKQSLAIAVKQRSFAPDGPLATSHGTRYPIVQGPMTRVSDTADFAQSVAKGGGLPFLALALMPAPEVDDLLKETSELLGERPWGVGILGFVPLELREEQLKVVMRYKPPFALIAGGRPDQARALEDAGIETYLHVPSPGLLKLFLKDNARRFVFEGRECGGHVGPRSSFVLWNTMIDVLIDELSGPELEKCHVLFAGGIHDEVSASMVAAMAAPLAERGVKIGVLVGTAYLFTKEAVDSGSIRPGFQQEAVNCGETVLVESGPGHAIRCVGTPFAVDFEERKRELARAGLGQDEIRLRLEEMNLGRLRLASKGLVRNPRYGSDPESPKLIEADEAEQHAHGMYMIGQVAGLRSSVTSIADLHEQISVGGCTRLEKNKVTLHFTKKPDARPSRVAIVGISCILPNAPDLATYWDNILKKDYAITEVPDHRWDWRLYYDENPQARDKIYSRWGGFLADVVFNPLDFGMPPSGLPSIDPMHLLALNAARAVLDDAGYSGRPFDRTRTSVILGASGGTGELGGGYNLRASLPILLGEEAVEIIDRADGILPEWTEDSFAGLLLNVSTGRIANRFDFGGVNYIVDAACASSLTSVHLAVKELVEGTSDTVLAGGIDTVNTPFGFMCFSKTYALSPTGVPKTFDADADGIAISEGIVMLMLKRLADAERDGDRIYAVIQSVSGSSDGRAKGLTAPRPAGQKLALERAYEKAGISPTTVDLFEAHGTGTVVGDRAEVESLSTFLEEAGAQPDRHAVGSVKSQIGHTKAAAGVAGLAKVALALHHKVLPPTLNVTKPDPKAGFRTGPLYVNSEARPWIGGTGDHPRRAGVSAFGFGGTNFHAVVEEYTGGYIPEVSVSASLPSELLAFTAPSAAELAGQIQGLASSLAQGAKPRLSDLAYTLGEIFFDRHGASNANLALVASSLDDLRTKLDAVAAKVESGQSFQDPRGIYFSTSPVLPDGRVAFLFSGQGSQYPNMLRELAIHFPIVRKTFERADHVLARQIPESLSRYIWPPPAFTPEEENDQKVALTATNIAQPALGACEVALVALLRELNVTPGMTAGHSYGEYSALFAAGVFDEKQLLEVSEARGRSIVDAAKDDLGTMAAVAVGEERARELLDSAKDVWIANLNAPEQTIISGTRAGIEAAMRLFEAEGIQARQIPVACAFHSPIVEPAKERLAEYLSSISIGAPKIDVYSNTTGALYPTEATEVGRLLAEHLVRPVRFSGQIRAMYADGARVFIEVGPKGVLTSLVGLVLGDRPHTALTVDNPGRHGVTQLQHALGQLISCGVPVMPGALAANRRVKRLNLGTLVADTSDKALPATAWLVNGAYARPANSPAPERRHLSITEMVKPDPSSRPGEQAAARPKKKSELPPDTSEARPADVEQVLVQYQATMSRFLETQREVMLAYLQGTPGPTQNSSPGLSEREETRRDEEVVSDSQNQPAGAEPNSVDVDAPIPNSGTSDLPDRHRLAKHLVQIVSERTGYPVEMLDLDVDVEAELGIDSIKLVEIVGILQKAYIPDAGQLRAGKLEQLATRKTLNGIIDWLREALAESVDEPASESVDQEAGPAAPSILSHAGKKDLATGAEFPIRRTTMRPVELDFPSGSELRFSTDGGVVLMTDDGDGVAEALASAIRDRGGRVVLMRHAESESDYQEPTEQVETNLGDFESVSATVDQIRRVHGSILGVIHLVQLKGRLPIGGDGASGALISSISDLNVRTRTETKSAFYLAKACGHDLDRPDGGSGVPFFLVATRTGNAWYQHSLSGLVKTLALEWPGVALKAVDMQTGMSIADEVDALIREISIPGPIEVAYRGGRRFGFESSEAMLEDRPGVQPPLDSGSVILITGGARGITAEVAAFLSERYRPAIEIVGRTPLPEETESADTASLESQREIKAAIIDRMKEAGDEVDLKRVEELYRRLMKEREIRDNLARMRATGARVTYHHADVRDEQVMSGLIGNIRRTHGRLDGVIHGAGVIEDRLVADKDAESFDRVFDTKVDGAFILSQLLDGDSLKFLVFFSSIAGSTGNRGQSDYAAANATLNGLAVHLDSVWPARVVAIGWGPWAKAGMVSPELQRLFETRGIGLIGVEAGCEAFDREIALGPSGEASVVIAAGGWTQAMITESDVDTSATVGAPS